MKIPCPMLHRNLIPIAAEIGLHDLYVHSRKVYGYVRIDGQLYRCLQDRITHYQKTGELRKVL